MIQPQRFFLTACFISASFFTAFGQGDLCKDIKSITAQYAKDKSKLMGKEVSHDDMMTSYECPFKLSGATSITADMYTASKKLAHVIGNCATDLSEAEAKKQFTALAEKLKACYPEAKTEGDGIESEELVADESDGSTIYLTRYISSTNTDTWENNYSIHIQIMFPPSY